jgi:UDP-N-acetylmuramoyl-L-alanyl-D-glutamate--2,6-diaminopimelate ligase
VLGVLLASGLSIDDALQSLRTLQPAPGRLERVPAKADAPLVLVDYAHKPDALEKALAACRTLATARQGRLIVVFGCGGDRDTGKRPLMGAIAEQLADTVILTSDNPRSENPQAIIAAIAAGLHAPGNAQIEADRAVAIRLALRSARVHDVVLIAGKGHETYQEIAGVKQPFSDVAVAAAALGEGCA